MLFQLAHLIDSTIASLNDPLLLAFVLPEPELFAWIFLASLAATAAALPLLIHHERRARGEARTAHRKPAFRAAA